MNCQKTLPKMIAAVLMGLLLVGCIGRVSTPTPIVIVVTATPEPTFTPVSLPPTNTPVVATPEPTPILPTATVTPEPTETAAANIATVTGGTLNVRSGPGNMYSIITTVQGGSKLTVLGQDGTGGWLSVRLPDGTEGWVFRSYTDFAGVAPLVPTPPPPPPPPTATPTRVPTVWRGEYYNNPNLAGSPLLVREDTAINFNWGHGAPAANLPTDEFSVRWTRQVSFPAGTYRFSVRSDDGVRVWLDTALIIDQWRDAAGVTYTADQTLAAGTHTLRVEYYERGGGAQIQFWWERPGDFPQWRGEYFSNADLVGEATLVRNDPAVDFNWGRSAPAGGLPADNFSVRWTRTLAFAEGGLYRFRAVVDDGVRVYVDGYSVIDEWRDGGRREVTADRKLSAGNHSVRIEYYERVGDALIQVWWEHLASYPDWRGEYWSNPNLEGNPILTRNDATIDFNWGRGAPAANVPGDNFSARWSRSADFEAATYRFHVIVDDGARLWVDGQLLIDEWRDSGTREVTADRALTQGPHSLRVDYYERTGDALIRVWWEKITTPSYPDWKGRYWSNRELSGSPALVRNDLAIDFDWKRGAPASGLPADEFSARWSRDVTFEAGVYRFYAQADDGIRFYVDDNLVLNEWHDATGATYTVDLTLSGQHRLKVEYYEYTGKAWVKFWWERVGP